MSAFWRVAYISLILYNLLRMFIKLIQEFCIYPTVIQRPEDVFLWSYLDCYFQDCIRTKIGRIVFLTDFATKITSFSIYGFLSRTLTTMFFLSANSTRSRTLMYLFAVMNLRCSVFNRSAYNYQTVSQLIYPPLAVSTCLN